MIDLTFHPLANLFPLLDGAAYDALRDDIRENGLHEDIVFYQGQILDGRNRYRACLEAGVEPTCRIYDGDEPLAYVIALNLHRRHLSESQRAMVAAQIANLQPGQTKAPSIEGAVSQTDAAALLNVGVASVERAAKVLRQATPEVIAAVQQGNLAVSKAVKVLRGETANIHVSDEDYEYYTPPALIAAAKGVMGGIDLDPASCAAANEIVGAATFYDRAQNGLTLPCSGRVWLNPPYAGSLVQAFISRLLDAYDAGAVSQAVLLVNNATDTRWAQELMARFPVCFTRGRLSFARPAGDSLVARQGQIIFYLGSNLNLFLQHFAPIGTILRAYTTSDPPTVHLQP